MLYLLLIVGIILFLAAIFGLATRSASREHRYNNIIKPAQEAERRASHQRRLDNRDAEIESHYTKRLNRAKRRDDPVTWLNLTNQMEKEKKITRRMDKHPTVPSGKPGHQAMPRGVKFHPNTGHISGGIGRETTKHHLRNPKPVSLKRVKGASGGKQSKTGKKGPSLFELLFVDKKKKGK